jgi:hypothetical protein
MSGPFGADHTLHWPAGFAPQCADAWARGEAAIRAARAVVFAHLITVRRWEQHFSGIRNIRVPAPGGGCLEPDSTFDLEIDGLRLGGQVTEFVVGHRLAWSGLGIDITTYHGWVISGDLGRCRVLAGFAARGAAAIALREPDPGLPQRMLGRWVADLKSAAEKPGP